MRNVVISSALALVIGLVAGHKLTPEPVNTVQTVTVTVPANGRLLVREIYQTLVAECNSIPWAHEPPNRPTCEEMAMMGTVRLMIDGRIEGPRVPERDI